MYTKRHIITLEDFQKDDIQHTVLASSSSEQKKLVMHTNIINGETSYEVLSPSGNVNIINSSKFNSFVQAVDEYNNI